MATKKHKVAKCLHITPQNCAILEHLGQNNSELVNKALEFYFKKGLKISRDDISKAYSQYMQKHYQLPLFKDDIEVKNDRINDMQKLSI